MTPTRVLTAVAALILFSQLILPPVVGVGNNGDFSRTYGLFHLTMPVADEVRFADTQYQFDPRVNYFGGFYSSEIVLVPPALALNTLFSKTGQFDVRFQGLIHAALFLAAAWLFLELLEGSPRAFQWRMGTLALAMFTDVMYVAYLNSFYTDVAGLLFLLLSVVLALRVLRWRRRRDLVLLAIASLFLATSKAQHAALGWWIALFFVALEVPKVAKQPPGGARWFAAVLAVVSAVWLWGSTPAEYAARGCFSTVFARILPHARDVDGTLAALGLDASYKPYIGMVSFSAGSPMGDPHFVAQFASKIGYGDLAVFLLTHPRDAYVALRVSLDEAGRERPALGNFDPSAALAPYAESQAFAGWSSLKRDLFEGRGSRYFTCFTATSLAVGGLLFWRRRRLPAGGMRAGLLLIGMAWTELAVSSLADAMEVPRHHLLFYALFDLLLLAGVWLFSLPPSGEISSTPPPAAER